MSDRTDPIYLDHNATTPLLPEVLEAMLPYLREHYGNPSSGHAYGRRARQAVEGAVSYLGVAADGRVRAAEVAALLREDTVLVTVMHANNETGVLQPIGDIARATVAGSVVLHT